MKSIRETATVALALLLVTHLGLAQTDEERAGARAAAEQGVKAYSEARWADTVDLMRRAERLVHAPTHLLYIGQAEEKLGHLVKANETYLKITRERLRSDAPAAFVAAQDEARQRADAIRGRLGQVSIVVQGNASNSPVKVTMDDNLVPEALLGLAHPIDPGEHRFEARGGDVESGVVTIQVREGGSETVVLTMKNAASVALPAAVTGTQPTEPPRSGRQAVPSPAETVPTSEQGSNGVKIGGYVAAGVGIVGAGLGTVFLVKSMRKRSDADALCNLANGGCPESRANDVKELDSTASSAGTIATVGFSVGAVGLATGIAMLLLSRPTESPAPRTAWIRPYIGPDAAGLFGRF